VTGKEKPPGGPEGLKKLDSKVSDGMFRAKSLAMTAAINSLRTQQSCGCQTDPSPESKAPSEEPHVPKGES